MRPQPKFTVGDKVSAIALPNGFPKPRPRIDGLTVVDVRLIECATLAPYYRITAHGAGLATVEGAEFHFEVAE
jgi:hypothetical protein